MQHSDVVDCTVVAYRTRSWVKELLCWCNPGPERCRRSERIANYKRPDFWVLPVGSRLRRHTSEGLSRDASEGEPPRRIGHSAVISFLRDPDGISSSVPKSRACEAHRCWPGSISSCCTTQAGPSTSRWSRPSAVAHLSRGIHKMPGVKAHDRLHEIAGLTAATSHEARRARRTMENVAGKAGVGVDVTYEIDRP